VRDQALNAEEMLLAAEQENFYARTNQDRDVLGGAGTQMASGSTNFMRLHLVTPEENATLRRQVVENRDHEMTRKILSRVSRGRDTNLLVPMNFVEA